MENAIGVIEKYAIYLYSGIISMVVVNFMLARSTKFDNNKFIYILLFGYSYMLAYTWITGVDVGSLTKKDNFIILSMSLIAPVLINYLYRKFKYDLEPLLFKLNINTSLEDTVFDRLYEAKNKQTQQKRNMYVRIYSTKLPFRYEGVIESYESDPAKEMIICLTRYRIKQYSNGGYVDYKDFSSREDRYLYLRITEIESMEIEYI